MSRLTDVNTVGNSQIAHYAYDYKGRRISKTDYTLSPAVCTLFAYDGDNLISEYDGSTLLRKYVFGPKIDEPVCMITVSGQSETKYYYHFDGLGSVVALTNNSGTIVEKYKYDVFGGTTILDSSNQQLATSNYANRYMFTGREYDSETGNYYYRARYYKPSIGRFLQPDPIGYIEGLNLYTYTKNNPITNRDPFGLYSSSSACGCEHGEPLTQIAGVGLWKAMIANRLKGEAFRVAAGTGLPGAHNGPQDAFRHCYWSCRMAQEIGPGDALTVGEIHELCGGGPENENMMDLFNNGVGRGLAGGDCRSGCLQALNDGRLKPSL